MLFRSPHKLQSPQEWRTPITLQVVFQFPAVVITIQALMRFMKGQGRPESNLDSLFVCVCVLQPGGYCSRLTESTTEIHPVFPLGHSVTFHTHTHKHTNAHTQTHAHKHNRKWRNRSIYNAHFGHTLQRENVLEESSPECSDGWGIRYLAAIT